MAHVTTTPAIETFGLTKHYGDTVAVEDVSLVVPRGVVFGYLGPNGAGKTTTIRMLLGLLASTEGRAEILGRDCWQDRERAHRLVGYLPGEFVAYPDLTAAQYLQYLGNLRGGVPFSHVEKLAERLDLRLHVRIGALSHGNRQKVGIVQAFMHRPEVLILDEPTSGLDPLIRQEFLNMVRETRAEGRTVFMSSHVLSEVEDCADVVGMIGGGRLMMVDRVAALRHRAVHRMSLTFATPPEMGVLVAVSGVRDVSAEDGRLRLTIEGSTAELLTVAAPYGITAITSTEPDLEELFLDLYDQRGRR